jgi:hypothetical protein
MFDPTPSFTTRDLSLASWLSARGRTLASVDSTIPKRMVFHFADVTSEDLSTFHTPSVYGVSPEELFAHYYRVRAQLFPKGGAK